MAVTIKTKSKIPPPPPVQLTAPAVKKKIGKQPEGTVTHEFKDGSSTEEKIPVGSGVLLNAPNATVTVSLGVTRNLGNYESVKATVSLTLPCDNNEKDIDMAFHEARGWVDTRIEMINQDIDTQLGKTE